MQCIRPLRAGFTAAGELTFKPIIGVSKELVGIQFECRRCLPCRLNTARDKAVRAIHEAKMHEDNMFLTLTYDEAHLESPRLIYSHVQTFIKDLRDQIGYEPDKRISTMITGEYGEKNKRPHWHALIFNYKPNDSEHHYTTDHGERVYKSNKIETLWGRGNTEFGSVTIESAGYVARYAAKKLVHGKDQDHDYHPIHKTSSRNAIGRSWIEKYYQHTFENGYIVLPNGALSRIPRYYVDWAKKHQPTLWERYVTQTRPEVAKKAQAQNQKEEMEFISELLSWQGHGQYPKTRPKVKETILQSKFKRLQERLKL